MSRFRAPFLQFIRTDQTKSVPRFEHTIGQGIHGTASRRTDSAQGGSPDPLRSETWEHSSQIVNHAYVNALSVAKFIFKIILTSDQSYWFWVSLSRTANSLYIYSITILPITRSAIGFIVHSSNWYVVAGLHSGRAVLGFTFIPGYKRVQSTMPHYRNARVSDDAGFQCGNTHGPLACPPWVC